MNTLEARVEKAIREKVFPGCVIGILRDGGKETFPFGHYTYEGDEAVREDTIYDLASITKSIPTASLAALFIEEGKLSLSDAVKKYIPELQHDHGATIEDLLRYRVRGPALSKLPLKTFEELRTHVFERGFIGPPGESVYTNLPAFLLGIVIERLGKKSLAALAEERFFEPLGMKKATFFPTPSDCAPTEIDARGEVRGLPHDESAYLFAIKRKSVGHAGLFSSARDLLIFADALLHDRHRMSVIRIYAVLGLGWQVEGSFFGSVPRGGSFGKTGFTGTSIVCDTARKRALVILANRTYPQRPANGEAINQFRRDISDIVFNTI